MDSLQNKRARKGSGRVSEGATAGCGFSPSAVTRAPLRRPSLFQSHLLPLFPLRQAPLPLSLLPLHLPRAVTPPQPPSFSLVLDFQGRVSFVVLVALHPRLQCRRLDVPDDRAKCSVVRKLFIESLLKNTNTFLISNFHNGNDF